MFKDKTKEKLLCKQLFDKVSEYFETPKHRTEFEQWYHEKYSKEYRKEKQNAAVL